MVVTNRKSNNAKCDGNAINAVKCIYAVNAKCYAFMQLMQSVTVIFTSYHEVVNFCSLQLSRSELNISALGCSRVGIAKADYCFSSFTVHCILLHQSKHGVGAALRSRRPP